MKVMKFGGSSVGSADAIRQTCELIKARAKPGDVIIESAVGTDTKAGKMTKVTDMLIEFNREVSTDCKHEIMEKIMQRHMEILKNLDINISVLGPEFTELNQLSYEDLKTKQGLDHCMSLGERMSVKMVAAQLNKMGLDAEPLTAYKVGLVTDSNFGSAVPLQESYKKIREALAGFNQTYMIITGFIGADQEGRITTLGRGGSDYSAAIFAAALGAEHLELWTDVNGIKSAHPKIVPEAHTIRHMSYDEAKELSFYGAKLHPKTIWPAMERNIPVYIMNTFDPDGEYTVITHERKMKESVVKGITCNSGNCMLVISSPRMIEQSGFLARVLDAFEVNVTDIDMVSTSEASISLTIKDTKMLNAIMAELKEMDPSLSIKVMENRSIVCVVGEGMRHATGTSGRLFSALGKARINVEAISQGASEINMTFVVSDEDASKAIQTVHNEFFRSKSDYMDDEEGIVIKGQ